MRPDTRERYDKAVALVAAGKPPSTAAKECGMNPTYFVKLRKQEEGVSTRTKARAIHIPQHDEEDSDVQVVILRGKSSVVQDIARSLGGVFNG